MPSLSEGSISGDQSAMEIDFDEIILRPYSCGMCDDIFEVENEFMEHCYRYYSDAPKKDTFAELRLLRYYPSAQERDHLTTVT